MSNKNRILTVKEFEEVCRKADQDLFARIRNLRATVNNIHYVPERTDNLNPTSGVH